MSRKGQYKVASFTLKQETIDMLSSLSEKTQETKSEIIRRLLQHELDGGTSDSFGRWFQLYIHNLVGGEADVEHSSGTTIPILTKDRAYFPIHDANLECVTRVAGIASIIQPVKSVVVIPWRRGVIKRPQENLLKAIKVRVCTPDGIKSL